jgi:hypothetical protein
MRICAGGDEPAVCPPADQALLGQLSENVDRPERLGLGVGKW